MYQAISYTEFGQMIEKRYMEYFNMVCFMKIPNFASILQKVVSIWSNSSH